MSAADTRAAGVAQAVAKKEEAGLLAALTALLDDLLARELITKEKHDAWLALANEPK